jgi:hypothetical protein
MKTIVKEFYMLDIEDIEKAVSEYSGEQQNIEDIGCTLFYHFDGFRPNGMSFVLDDVNGEFISSYDLFYDKEKKGHYLNGKRLNLDEPWLSENEVFCFDISAFGSFEIDTELDD